MMKQTLKSFHLMELKNSGLSDETIEASGIHSGKGAEIGKLLGWKRSAQGDGLIYPYPGCDDFARVKLDHPRPDRGKYESPYGQPNRAYIMESALERPGPIVIVEGEKKALAVWQLSYAVVGISGVWNWAQKRERDADGKGIGERILIPDLQAIEWIGRDVVICFDSDVATNPKVQHGERELAKILQSKGATVRIARIPAIGDAKAGADDYIQSQGEMVFRKIIEQAEVFRLVKNDHELAKTDLGFAERLVRDHGADLRYCPGIGWLAWDGKRWSRDETGEVDRRCKATLRKFQQWVLDKITDDADKRKVWLTAGLEREKADKIKGIIALARTEPSMPILPNSLDADSWKLNCSNGTIDLKTGELHPHRKEDLITKLAECEYDTDAKCPQWKAFLRTTFQGDKEMIQFTQRALGYSLTGQIAEHCLHVLHGTGANGKSTLINVMLGVMGDYGIMGAPKMLVLRRNDQHPTELADLRGRRFVACAESAEGNRLDEERVKMLTGGDRIKARMMRQDFFEFEPTHKLFLCTNHRPDIRGRDEGIWRRIKLWPFNYVVPPDDQDPELTEHLITDEAPGILAWCVRGCRLWRRDGLNDPPAVSKSTQTYRQESDEMGEFLTAMCEMGEGRRCQAGDLYAAYRDWGGESNQTNFGRQLRERGIEKSQRNGRVVYKGLDLVNSICTARKAGVGTS